MTFLESSIIAMADREKKRGRWKWKKIEYLENKKSFLDEIKTFFIAFEGLSFDEKKKIIWEKIADTSFKGRIILAIIY